MRGLVFKTINYKDHFTYTKKNINKITSFSDGNLILTTEKDYYKLQDHMIQIYYFTLKLTFILAKKILNYLNPIF